MDNSYPSRPSSHRRQYSRTMAATHNNNMPCPSSEKQCIVSPHCNNQVTPEKLSEPQVFEFLYGIIFSMIHTALMTILAPVLGDDKKKRSSKRRESSKISPMRMQQVDVSPEVIEEGAYGTPPQQQQQQLQPAVDNSDCISVASHSSQHSSRSHTHRHPTTILRRGSDPSSEKINKQVRFPSRNVRAQPPLGRIGYSSQRSASSSSSSSNNSGSSLSSNDSERRRERRTPRSVAPVTMSTRRPRRSSPLRTMVTQRMAHTSYFLE